jgi:hypothetical protein
MTDRIQILDNLKLELDKLIDQSQQSLQETKKVAAAQAWKILQLAIALSIQFLENIAVSFSGPDKKLIAMEAISSFYDKVFTIVDVPFIPGFIEPLMHRYIKAFLMGLVGVSIDAMVTTFREIGVFKDKDVKSQSLVSKKPKSIKTTKKRK